MSWDKIWRGMLVCMIALLVVSCGRGREEEAPTTETAGDAAEPAQAAVVDSATAGSITGQILFTGTAPEPTLVQMDAEPTCQEMYEEGPFTEDVVVNDNGTLANVFVHIKTGLEDMTFPTPSESVAFDQEGCRYHPHVLGVQTDQVFVIRNSDSVLHNIHPEPVENRSFNVSQPRQDMETERSFPNPEIMIPVACDVHGWMSAYISVVPHPYFAVTGSDGSFELSNVPPGDYVVEVWHETYGSQTMDVTVGESETATAEFTFEGS